MKETSLRELFAVVQKHCYWFHPTGRTQLNLKVWKQVLRALRRAHQYGDTIPVSVWSLCNLITSALQPFQSESESGQSEIVPPTRKESVSYRDYESAGDILSRPLPALPKHKGDSNRENLGRSAQIPGVRPVFGPRPCEDESPSDLNLSQLFDHSEGNGKRDLSEFSVLQASSSESDSDSPSDSEEPSYHVLLSQIR